ncbi:hypothetical protein LTR51_006435 [Lithohypha guttulata]|uniref:Uncharacterized protein n=2 Tax=Lithohypha guttulata TaxID=1690604 RepID=A0AAN7T4T9_9EURO|nr:hypothetical protein LTR51_006435 [Lithohypha guttulata]KAK5088643.1 hypothetical protein LTR05_002863 [Lithohypha guttulata]
MAAAIPDDDPEALVTVREALAAELALEALELAALEAVLKADDAELVKLARAEVLPAEDAEAIADERFAEMLELNDARDVDAAEAMLEAFDVATEAMELESTDELLPVAEATTLDAPPVAESIIVPAPAVASETSEPALVRICA